jgi:RNA polymerase sigma-70 factor, ECF subfamily
LDPLLAAAEQVIEGRSAAFRLIVEATSARLVRLAFRILGDRGEAEDVVQEGYVRAHQALREGRFDGNSTIQTWLYRIVTHTAIDAARRTRRQARLAQAVQYTSFSESHDPDSHLTLKELAGWLHELPKDQHAALLLKTVEELPSSEVAKILECSEGAVEQRLVRARVSLRKWVSAEQDVLPLLQHLPFGVGRV